MSDNVGQVNSAEDLSKRIVKHARNRSLTEQDVTDAKKARSEGSNDDVVKLLAGIQGVQPNDLSRELIAVHNWALAQKRKKKQSGQASAGFLVLLFIGVIGVLLLWAGWNYTVHQPGYQAAAQQTERVVTPNLGLVQTDHTTKHDEAEEIINTCDKNGPYQTWKDRYESNKYYYMCKISGNNKFGIVIFLIESGTKYIKTAFSPGDASMSDVSSYLQAQGTVFRGILK